jgi:hypothetical protein
MHYLAGKSTIDAGYKEVNHQSVYDKDEESYRKYTESQFQKDVRKIQE